MAEKKLEKQHVTENRSRNTKTKTTEVGSIWRIING